jgi:SAM-dependent methyltransferase
MNIVWLVDGVTGDWSGGYESKLASNRYRAIIPGTELHRLQHEVHFVAMSDGLAVKRINDLRPDFIVVAKQFGWQNPARYQEVAANLREGLQAAAAQGCRVVVDFCDDHFDDAVLGPNWRALAAMAHACVTGSDELRQTVQAHTSAPVYAVGDPIASPLGQPRVFRPQSRVQSALQGWLGGSKAVQRLRMVWYGNPVNVAALFAWTKALAPLARERPWWLSVVTAPAVQIENSIAQFNSSQGGNAAMELVPWSEDAQWIAVRDADVVLIPSDVSKAAKRAKTANRLTDALHMGRYVIASPVPAYSPYSDYASITDKPLEAIQEYLRNPAQSLANIENGQQAAIERASTAFIAGRWLEVLTLLQGAPIQRDRWVAASEVPQPMTQTPVRLNLGCGDKILPGYVNVDVVESRAGRSPDVICDLRNLAIFPDGHAEEVLAVHVVEHFWRWEIEAVLREWARVLKPGGQMVLECPNLKSACEAFLADPVNASRQDKEGQRSMWVFYGDPQWKDPLMVHRWGYTPASLAALMEAVGLIEARQEPAQFKLREPRDMRVVATKPLSSL